MTLVKWKPFHEMVSLRNAMDCLLEESFSRSLAEWPESARAGLPISMDIYEDSGSLVIQTDLPGLKVDDIEVNVSGKTLTIKGEFNSKSDGERENVYLIERRSGKFQRIVASPDEVDTDNIDSVFEDGVLKLSLPRTEEAKPKQISVQGKS